MLAEIAAVIASVCWAAAAISVRKALQTSAPLTASFASVVTNVTFLWPAALLLTSFDQVQQEGVIILILAGLAAPTLGRLMRFMAVDRLGVAPSAPLINSVPLFSAILAVSFLGETVNLPIGLGTAAILAGIMLLSLGEQKAKVSKVGILVALASAVSYGTAIVMYRVGATSVGSPILGAAIGATVASGTYALYSVIAKQPIEGPRRWNRFHYLNGVFTGLALALTYTSTFLEEIVIVGPLLNITPLFVLLFTRIFLKKLERVSVAISLAAILVVLGSILVATG